MTDEELLKTPISELIEKGLLSQGIAAKERKNAAIQKKNKNFQPKFSAPTIISDDLGTKGVLNPATGKIHDSKSAYYRDVKESGHIINEPGMNNPQKNRPQRGNYVSKQEVYEAAKRTGLLDKLDNPKQRKAILRGEM